jgi:hypothetical protein
MDQFPTWPHLENLERILRERPLYLESLPDVPDAQWYITEKLHGFNARVGRTSDGIPWCGSRNTVVAQGESHEWPEDGLQGFIGWASWIVGRLQPGITLFGEWAGKGIQKGIDYGERDFHAFGLMRDGVLQDPAKLFEVCTVLEVKHVPLLGYGRTLPPLAELDALRKEQSVIADQTREGIVIFPWPLIEDEYGHVLIAKFKAPDFAETAHARKDKPAPANLESVEAFVAEYATQERFTHVIQQALEVGPYDPFDNRMIGTVLRLMYDDVVREGKLDFDQLSPEDQKQVGRVLNPITKNFWTVEALREISATD